MRKVLSLAASGVTDTVTRHTRRQPSPGRKPPQPILLLNVAYCVIVASEVLLCQLERDAITSAEYVTVGSSPAAKSTSQPLTSRSMPTLGSYRWVMADICEVKLNNFQQPQKTSTCTNQAATRTLRRSVLRVCPSFLSCSTSRRVVSPP